MRVILAIASQWAATLLLRRRQPACKPTPAELWEIHHDATFG